MSRIPAVIVLGLLLIPAGCGGEGGGGKGLPGDSAPGPGPADTGPDTVAAADLGPEQIHHDDIFGMIDNGAEPAADSGSATDADAGAEASPDSGSVAAAPNWTDHIAPLLADQVCKGCHIGIHPDCSGDACWVNNFDIITAAPQKSYCTDLGFTTRAECIVSRMTGGSMPPFNVVDGTPLNVPSVDQSVIDTVQAWIDAGLPKE